MYKQIKQLADEAVALQNKDRMDEALRGISAMCTLASDDGAKLIGFVDAGTAFPFDRAADAAPGDALAELMPDNAISRAIATYSGGFLVAGDHNPSVIDFPATAIAPPAKQTAPEPDPAHVSRGVVSVKNEYPADFAPTSTRPSKPAKKRGAK